MAKAANFELGRRGVLAGLAVTAAAGALAAGCQRSAGESASAMQAMALGPEGAKVSVVEFASVTCSHCRDFHANVFKPLKEKYIDTGKIRYEFREFLTAPPEVAVAGFLLARCGGATTEQYFARVNTLFEQQPIIFEALQRGQGREPLLNIARAAGLSEEQFKACISDEAAIARLRTSVDEAGKKFEITGTPTLLLNGEKLTDPNAYTFEGLTKLIDAKLAG